MGGESGFEPLSADSESAVLPLDDSPVVSSLIFILTPNAKRRRQDILGECIGQEWKSKLKGLNRQYAGDLVLQQDLLVAPHSQESEYQ